MTSTEHSLDSDGSCGVALSDVNPLLQTGLLSNGGPTPIHSLEKGSPAIAAGGTTTCVSPDQRGDVRSSPCSIGADEYTSTAPTIKVPATITKVTSGTEEVVEYTAEATGVNDLVRTFGCTPESGSKFPIGTTKVKCTAEDGHENVATAEFSIIVKAEEGLKEGHPQAFSNGIKAGATANGIGQLGYGDIDLTSTELSSTLECTGIGLATGFNGGSPVRALGQVLAFSAAGHAPNEADTETELSAQCRGLAAAWVTDETPANFKSGEESRGEITTPWNAEAECGTREKAKTAIVKIGVPTSRTTAQVKAAEERGCDTEAVETTETSNEISKKEGCYQSNPSPAGCINVLIVDPAAALEVGYGGTLRAKVINGAGNGLDQTRFEFEAKSGELQCQHPVTCTAKATVLGSIKNQGYEAAQLINYK